MIPQYENTIERFRQKRDQEMPTRVYKIDWENNRLSSTHIEGREAINQAIQVISSLELGDWGIFPEWFGLEMKNMYGMPTEFVKANLARLITEACNTDDRIIELRDFTIEEIDHALVATFTVVCTEGAFESEVSIDV